MYFSLPSTSLSIVNAHERERERGKMGRGHSKPSSGAGAHEKQLLEENVCLQNKADNVYSLKELQRILHDIKCKNIKIIRVEFTDINCVTRCKLISVRSLEEASSTLTQGLLFSPTWFMKDPAGRSFESAFKRKFWFSDICALPCLDTFRVIPWLENTAIITTDLYHLNMKALVVEHPRTVAKQQLQRLEKIGFSLMSGFELEFRLCDAKGGDLFSEPVGFSGTTMLLSMAKDYVKDLFEYLPQMGINVDTVHSESPMGSLEVTYKPSFGIKAADDAVMCRNACKEIAPEHGYIASFMPSPESLGDGFTLHLNHSIWSESGNLVSISGTENLTETAKHWIAGLLTHARALTPLMAPTVNGIKMFGGYQPPSSVEPSFITWGRHNRSVTFRVKSTGPQGSYIENRLGRSDADPYLMIAGTVAAGIDGIINKLSLPPECTGDAHNERDIPPLTLRIPCDMEDGIAALLEDKVICEALGEDFIDLIVAARRHEINNYKTAKTVT